MNPLLAEISVDGVAGTLAYAAVGTLLLVVGVFVVDVATPGKLFDLLRGGSPNAAAIIVANLAAVAAIVVAAGISGADSTWEGLGSMALYGGLGIVIQALFVFLVDNVLRFDWNVVLPADRLQPTVAVAAAVSVAIGAIMVVAVV